MNSLQRLARPLAARGVFHVGVSFPRHAEAADRPTGAKVASLLQEGPFPSTWLLHADPGRVEAARNRARAGSQIAETALKSTLSKSMTGSRRVFSMDPYEVLNFKLIDTASEAMRPYNGIYQPFNCIEGLIWLIFVPRTLFKYWKSSDKRIVVLQSVSFLLFAVSDFIEVYSTTPLLILFKAAVLIALVVGHQALIATQTPAQPVDLREPPSADRRPQVG